MKVLSLFDGMACGMLAMRSAGIKVDRYVAFEIDKYAVQTSAHNFPMIEHRGDVFQADFSEFRGFDFVVGGSPCTYWSIAQKNNRETEASGMGWELFSQYVRAVKEAQPLYFIYENNKSMSNAIRQSITETFGFEPICINSALVSAQNRQRLYWVGKRNLNGTYSRIHVEQPEDRGILLRDVLDGAGPVGDSNDKAFCMTASYQFGCSPHDTLSKSIRSLCAEPVNVCETGKAQCLKSQYGKSAVANFMNGSSHYPASGVAEPVGTTQEGKAFCLTANYQGAHIPHSWEKSVRSMAAEPVCMRYQRSEEAKKVRKQYEAGEIKHGFHELSELHPRTDGKTNTLSTVLKDNPICEPVGVGYRGRMEDGAWKKRYEAREDQKANALTTAQTDSMVGVPVRVGALPRPNGELSTSQAFRVYAIDGKSVNITAGGGGAGGKTGLYAIPVEFDGDTPTKAISYADGKTYTVFEVQGGQITIKEKQYPIKLADGYYIIRKLTVSECKRLQTVPEWYEFPVSDTQAYKMLGNGWTVEVIAYLIAATQANTLADEQLDLFSLMEGV